MFSGVQMSIYTNIKNYVRNIWKFRKSLTEHSPCDYQGLLLISREVIQDMYDYQSTADFFVSVNRDKQCKHMKTCTLLLDRLIKDDYILLESNKSGLPVKKLNHKRSSISQKQDLELFTKLLNKHLLYWWH